MTSFSELFFPLDKASFRKWDLPLQRTPNNENENYLFPER